MPPQTGLGFQRKKQTIEHFSLERPKNLQNFYEAVEEGLKEVEQRLQLLELEYIGRNRTPEQEIKEWIPDLEIVMKYARTSVLFSKRQLKDVFDLYERSIGDPTMVVDFDKDAVQTVLDVMTKVGLFHRQRFNDINELMLKILGYMRKYCLSFSATDGDAYLETATNYEKQRRELADAIKLNLDDIPQMANRFENEGVSLQEFGSVPNRLAERCECSHLPFLVMFSGACENVRNACIGVRKWIQADDGYATFIVFDIADLESKREECGKTLKELQNKVSQLDHIMKACKRDIQDCIVELKRLVPKEKGLRKQEHQISDEIHDLEIDFGAREIQKEHFLKTNLPKDKEKLEKVIADMEQMSFKKPLLHRKLDEVQRKLELIKYRRDLKLKLERETIETKNTLKDTRKELRRNEIECDRLDRNLLKLREIHRFKCSPEVLKKLFYNMPLPNKTVTLGGITKRKGNLIDKLEKAIRVTADRLDRDWVNLYRILPFYPPRGEENLRMDIEDITKNFLRETAVVHARQSLLRWRRLHTRASINDLKKSLLTLKRKDIVDKIDEGFATKKIVGKAKANQTVKFPRVLVQNQNNMRGRNGILIR